MGAGNSNTILAPPHWYPIILPSCHALQGLETIHDTEADEGNLREGGAQSAASGGGDAAPTAAVASAPQERVQDAKERDIEQGL